LCYCGYHFSSDEPEAILTPDELATFAAREKGRAQANKGCLIIVFLALILGIFLLIVRMRFFNDGNWH
jgi:hypothetical protein